MKRLLSLLFVVSLVSGISYANCGNDKSVGNGCSNDPIVGPQGPQGDRGLPGLNGTDGKDGSNGIDGVNGKDGSNATVDPEEDDTKVVADMAIRLYDGKRVQIQAFDTFRFGSNSGDDVLGDGRNHMVGVRVIFKLGKSYEERLIEDLRRQLNAVR